MIELRHMDVSHFVIIECSHLANGCTTKSGCVTKFVLNLLDVLEYMATNVLSLTLSTLRVFSPPLHDDAPLLSPVTTPTTQPPTVYVAGAILSIV